MLWSNCVVYSNCDVLLVCVHAKNHGEHRVFNFGICCRESGRAQSYEFLRMRVQFLLCHAIVFIQCRNLFYHFRLKCNSGVLDDVHWMI